MNNDLFHPFCTKLPGSPGDKWEDDFVPLSDVFPTGFFATQLAKVQPGFPVAVFGAGPVGLLWEKGMTVGTGQTPVKKLQPI